MESAATISVPGPPALLADAPTSLLGRRAACTIALVSAVVIAAVVPIASEPWPPAVAFVPGLQVAIGVNDLVTAALLLGQFHAVRRPSLLLLVGGYLFTACIVAAHTLSFPGLFGPGILLGNVQTASLLWFAWHIVPAIGVLGYALLAGSRRDAAVAPGDARQAIAAAMLLPPVLAGGCILVAVYGSDQLPTLLQAPGYVASIARPILAMPFAASVAALLALVARTRLRRALDLWLAVAVGAWAVECLLSAVVAYGRFEAGFYIGRIYALLASCTVLASLLLLAAATHRRLAGLLILERARADDLERSQAALRQAQKMEAVGQLTSGMAHDFNNLLTGILAALDMLARDPLSARGRRMMGVAQQSAERGAALIGQLLAFSREHRLEFSPIDVNALAAGMRDLLRSTLGAGVQVVVAPQPGLPHAHADRTQVEVVLLNLAINARDAMPNGGSILVETSLAVIGEPDRPEEPPAGEWVCLSVTDTGEGMSAEVLERVFEPFFTTKPVGHGSGLGLPQVLGVAKQLGGGVRIASALGEGCKVSLYLPLAPVAAEPLAAVPLPSLDEFVRREAAAQTVDGGY